jgi:hypothetical protein
MTDESDLALKHLRANDGRIDVTEPRVRLRPTSIDRFPSGWGDLMDDVAEHWWDRHWRAGMSRT